MVTGRLEQRSWETENGEKRSVVEIIADEIGPSLRWATAEVTRNDRRGGGDFAGRWRRRAGRRRSGPAPEGGGSPSGGGGPSGGGSPSGGGTGGYDDMGEEPF